MATLRHQQRQQVPLSLSLGDAAWGCHEQSGRPSASGGSVDARPQRPGSPDSAFRLRRTGVGRPTGADPNKAVEPQYFCRPHQCAAWPRDSLGVSLQKLWLGRSSGGIVCTPNYTQNNTVP
jgi:hypothetical protein